MFKNQSGLESCSKAKINKTYNAKNPSISARVLNLERHTRFELVTSTLARLRSTNWASVALVAGAGFEPTTFGLWARRATKLLHPASVIHHFKVRWQLLNLERHTRFELVTSTLARLRSTNWASVAQTMFLSFRAANYKSIFLWCKSLVQKKIVFF